MQVTAKNFSSRNRKSQSEFRKKQLIEATIDCIDRLGISQTTMAKIAQHAGISQGNVIFHFHSKEELLEQTLHYLNDEYRENWQQAIKASPPDPVAQLVALVRSSFNVKICNRKRIGVWFAYWGESRSRPGYMKVCGDTDLEFSNRLRALCEEVEAAHGSNLAAETAALSLEGMTDGLWQYILIGAEKFKRKQAETAVFELLKSIYPNIASQIDAYM